MTAQEYLEQARLLDLQIESKKMQLERLRDLTTKVTGTMSEDVVSHTRNVHSMEDVIASAMDMENEIKADLQRAFALKKEISDTIRSVEDVNERLVLEYRYLNYLSWNEVAERLDRSRRYALEKHSSALKKISEIIKKVALPCTSAHLHTPPTL